MMTDELFQRLRQLADAQAGIALYDRHRESISRRFERLRLNAAAVIAGAERGEPNAQEQVINLLTTNHTSFFRHPHQLEKAARHALDAADRRGTARIWSAAASTGAEPWSLAMAVLALSKDDRPAVSILATDIDAIALAVGEAGIYSDATLAAIPAEQRRRWVDADGKISPAVRALVRFQRLNLVKIDWPIAPHIDVVCCRNVLMYLSTDYRYAVLERIAALLADDGLLLLDPSEHPGSAAIFFHGGSGGAYSLRPRSRSNVIPPRSI